MASVDGTLISFDENDPVQKYMTNIQYLSAARTTSIQLVNLPNDKLNQVLTALNDIFSS